MLCLSSVLLGTVVPAAINIRLEGDFPDFNHFYLEQLAELARIAGVDWNMNVGLSKGIRYARDWQLDHCTTKYLWTGDDDVIFDSLCLSNFSAHLNVSAIQYLLPTGGRFYPAFLQGSKADVNNRRGYPDHSKTVYEQADDVSYHSFFAQACACPSDRLRQQLMLDPGNAVLSMSFFRSHALRFSQFPDGFNAAGEDALMALHIHAEGSCGLRVPSARAFHLEKPAGSRFGETAARAEAVLRSAQLKGYDASVLGKDFVAYEKKNDQ